MPCEGSRSVRAASTGISRRRAALREAVMREWLHRIHASFRRAGRWYPNSGSSKQSTSSTSRPRSSTSSPRSSSAASLTLPTLPSARRRRCHASLSSGTPCSQANGTCWTSTNSCPHYCAHHRRLHEPHSTPQLHDQTSSRLRTLIVKVGPCQSPGSVEGCLSCLGPAGFGDEVFVVDR